MRNFGRNGKKFLAMIIFIIFRVFSRPFRVFRVKNQRLGWRWIYLMPMNATFLGDFSWRKAPIFTNF